jgi:hypothetical protein
MSNYEFANAIDVCYRKWLKWRALPEKYANNKNILSTKERKQETTIDDIRQIKQ